MKYFIDTEFIERPGSIHLISIGIVAEDGREYYAVSREFNLREVWKDEWLKKNVLLPIYIERINGDMRNHNAFSKRSMQGILKGFGKTTGQIAEEILDFCSNTYFDKTGLSLKSKKEFKLYDKFQPEFYGYYADYDWVVFCWLFGRMIDLPKSFPMYCRDLKQMMDERGLDKEWKKEHCPDPLNEHNALADAKWNKNLYEKIINQVKIKI